MHRGTDKSCRRDEVSV